LRELLCCSRAVVASRSTIRYWHVTTGRVKGLRIPMVRQKMPSRWISLPRIAESGANTFGCTALELKFLGVEAPCHAHISDNIRVEFVDGNSVVVHGIEKGPGYRDPFFLCRVPSWGSGPKPESHATQCIELANGGGIVSAPCFKDRTLLLLHTPARDALLIRAGAGKRHRRGDEDRTDTSWLPMGQTGSLRVRNGGFNR